MTTPKLPAPATSPASTGSADPRVVKHGWKPSSETERCFSCKHNALCKSEVSYFMEYYWCAAYQPNAAMSDCADKTAGT